MQLGIGIGRAALVAESDPTLQIESVVSGIEFGDIVGLPRQSARKIAKLKGLRAGSGAVQVHHQGGAIAQIVRNAVKYHSAGDTHLDAVTHLKYYTVVSA